MSSIVRGSDNFDSSVGMLGVGQSWQNVLGSRVSGTTYTNTTGKPIMVSVSAGYYGVQAYVNGLLIAQSNANGAGTNNIGVQFIVPNGDTYSCNPVISGTTFSLWAELR